MTPKSEYEKRSSKRKENRNMTTPKMRKREAKTKILRIRVSPKLLARLHKTASLKGKKVSEIARLYLREGVRNENVLR